MRVWIDLANSPHPLIFEPVARLLEREGHEVAATARDNAQTVELARAAFPEVEVIGGPSPKNRAGKVAALGGRVASLARFARRRRPDVALSHNSYAQLAVARCLRIPAVTAMDYEHQPANHLAFRLASTVLLPEALRNSGVAAQGASDAKTTYYDGLKEEIYLGAFTPDPSVLDSVGLADRGGTPLVVARTAPSKATYHRFENELFFDALRLLEADPGVRCVVLPRYPEEADRLRALGRGRLVVPPRAVNSRSLMVMADLVLGAGGTMTREAALLGSPTLSVFSGRAPAVDRWLVERGLLGRLERADDILPVRCRTNGEADLGGLRTRGECLRAQLVAAVVGAGRGG